MSALGGPSSTTNLQSSTGSSRFSELSSEDFVRIIFTELSNQDPLDPSDSSALLEQLSSLRSIESDIDLGNKLEAIVSQNQLSTAGALIGKFVAGLSENYDSVAGYVISVSSTADGPVLNLDNGYRVPFDQVDELFDPSIFDDPADPADPADPVDETGSGDTTQDDTTGDEQPADETGG